MPALPNEHDATPEQLRISLSAREIREQLTRPQKLEDLPAAKILEDQITAIYLEIQRQIQEQSLAKNPSKAEQALALAQYFSSVGLYQRISGQAFYGIRQFERIDAKEQVTPHLLEIQQKLREAVTKIQQQKPSINFSNEDSWKQINQGKSKPTAYRIYLSPQPTAAPDVYRDIALAMPDTVSYKMKTPDLAAGTPGEQEALLMTRNDKIVMYVPEDELESVLTVLQKVLPGQAKSLQGRLAPGGGTVQLCDGVSLAREPQELNGQKITGTQEVAQKMGDQLIAGGLREAKNAFAGSRSIREMAESSAGRLLFQVLEGKADQIKWYPMDKSQWPDLSRAYLQAVWAAALESFFTKQSSTDVRIRELLGIYLDRNKVQLSPEHKKHILTNEKFLGEVILQGGSPQVLLSEALATTGIALVSLQQLEQGKPVQEGFGRLLKSKWNS